MEKLIRRDFHFGKLGAYTLRMRKCLSLIKFFSSPRLRDIDTPDSALLQRNIQTYFLTSE
jgi:hypothetical protein